MRDFMGGVALTKATQTPHCTGFASDSAAFGKGGSLVARLGLGFPGRKQPGFRLFGACKGPAGRLSPLGRAVNCA